MCAQSLSRVWLYVTTWTVVARLLCLRNFPGKKTTVGCHLLPQRIFPTQGSNQRLLCLLHRQAGSLPLSHLGSSQDTNWHAIKTVAINLCLYGSMWYWILEWVASPFSRGSFWPGIKPRSLALQANSLPPEPTGKPNFLFLIVNKGGIISPVCRWGVWGSENNVIWIR